MANRTLFAIDGLVTGGPWEQVRSLPLDEVELAAIAQNLAPDMTGTSRSR
ncbi:MAG TPA: hypothetical protein VJ813_08005 [Vicinamibacterales bacterium]|nr:hypothetical protein [Vicinamibacterales bacterium]